MGWGGGHVHRSQRRGSGGGRPGDGDGLAGGDGCDDVGALPAKQSWISDRQGYYI